MEMKFRERSEKAKWMLQCAYEVLIRHINQCYRETSAAPLHFWERILTRDTGDERLLGERLVYPPRPQGGNEIDRGCIDRRERQRECKELRDRAD